MNPCPAGRSCKEQTCRCSASQVQRYQSRISGPLLDRIDLHVLVAELDPQVMLDVTQIQAGTPPACFTRKQTRGGAGPSNPVPSARLPQRAAPQEPIYQSTCTTANIDWLLQPLVSAFELSLRSYHKLWRVALTLADLDQSTEQKSTGRNLTARVKQLLG